MANVSNLVLQKDYENLLKCPIKYIEAKPEECNILRWQYVFIGPPDTPYYGGIYHGMLIFPRTYPYEPPSIYMFTPNGRFRSPGRICLTNSDFHPETWVPSWSVSSLLISILSYMLDDQGDIFNYTMRQPVEIVKKLAIRSFITNRGNEDFVRHFPHYANITSESLKNLGQIPEKDDFEFVIEADDCECTYVEEKMEPENLECIQQRIEKIAILDSTIEHTDSKLKSPDID